MYAETITIKNLKTLKLTLEPGISTKNLNNESSGVL